MPMVTCCNFYGGIDKKLSIYETLRLHILSNIHYEKLLDKNLKPVELHYPKD
jgi:hypothetical protein